MAMPMDNRFSLLVAGLLAATLLLGASQPAAAQAQPEPELERREPGVLMGERAFRRFDNLTQLYTEGKYREALTAAQNYLAGTNLNDYERAMGEQIYGFTLIALDRIDDAVPRFERAIELNVLSNRAHFDMMKALAQLYASREQWQKSIDMMTEYLRYQPTPTPEDSIMMGQSYAQMERYREALPWIRRAIENAKDGKPAESWYQLELAIHFELRDFRAGLRVLNKLVARWPERLRYWETMAGAHT